MRLIFWRGFSQRVVFVCSMALCLSGLICQAQVGFANAAAVAPKISGTMKALKGPNGEVVGVVEVNGNKEAMVFFKNVAGSLKGTTKLYKLKETASDSKDVFYTIKRGSKYKDIMVLTLEHGDWTFINPGKEGDRYPVYFSDKETAKLKESDFFTTLKP